MSDRENALSGLINRFGNREQSPKDGHHMKTVSAVLPRSEAKGKKKEEFVVIGLGRLGFRLWTVRTQRIEHRDILPGHAGALEFRQHDWKHSVVRRGASNIAVYDHDFVAGLYQFRQGFRLNWVSQRVLKRLLFIVDRLYERRLNYVDSIG